MQTCFIEETHKSRQNQTLLPGKRIFCILNWSERGTRIFFRPSSFNEKNCWNSFIMGLGLWFMDSLYTVQCLYETASHIVCIRNTFFFYRTGSRDWKMSFKFLSKGNFVLMACYYLHSPPAWLKSRRTDFFHYSKFYFLCSLLHAYAHLNPNGKWGDKMYNNV